MWYPHYSTLTLNLALILSGLPSQQGVIPHRVEPPGALHALHWYVGPMHKDSYTHTYTHKYTGSVWTAGHEPGAWTPEGHQI